MPRHWSFDRRGFSLMEIMIVVAITCVVAAIAVPMMTNQLGFFRLSGDARSVSNSIAVAKMRAASVFGRVRLYVDLNTNSYRVESWDKATSLWKAEGGVTYLSSNVSFKFNPVTVAPPNTQTTIAQATPCTDAMDMPIGNTACLMFNSRGVPVVQTAPGSGVFTPTVDALYVSDGTAVYAVSVVATGMIRMWRAQPVVSPTWVLN